MMSGYLINGINIKNLADIISLSTAKDRLVYIEAGPCEQRITNEELSRRTIDLAISLKALGYEPGARIGLMMRNGIAFIQSYLAIMKAGFVAVPVNYRLAASTIDYIFEDAGIVATFVDSERRGQTPKGILQFNVDHPNFDGLLQPGKLAITALADGYSYHIAKILYTSGSTGTPKGVPLSHAGQLWALGKYYDPVGNAGTKSALVVAPTYHKNGLFFSMVALMNGMTIVSLPKFDAREYLTAAAHYRCSALSGVPTMFSLILREEDLIRSLDLSCVETVSMGSAPLTLGLMEKLQGIFPNARITNNYGTTEAGPCVFGAHPEGRLRPMMSVGYPLPDIEWKLVDGPNDREGVLYLRTPAMMREYLNLPDATARQIKDGWYCTGDIMRQDQDGFFYFVGRSDDMFVCGGENIYPREVEGLLEHHPLISQAVVVPASDAIKGEIPVAFVVTTPAVTLTEREVKDYCLANGPAYSHPRFVIFKQQLPLAGTQKVDLKALRIEAQQLVSSAGRA